MRIATDLLKMQYSFKFYHMNPTEKARAEISPTEIISSERNVVDGTKEKQLWESE